MTETALEQKAEPNDGLCRLVQASRHWNSLNYLHIPTITVNFTPAKVHAGLIMIIMS